MKQHSLLLAACAVCTLVLPSYAGHEIVPVDGKDAKKEVVPLSICDQGRRGFLPEAPLGLLTVGGQFSNKLSGFYVDTITGLYSSQDAHSFVFLDSRYNYEDIGQLDSQTGLGFRQLISGHDIIIGANAFYDQIGSFRGSDFDQFGFGAEVLTKWVDARFSYYLPTDDKYTVERSHEREHAGVPGGEFVRHRTFETYEGTLQGFDAEVGFLIPGLDRFAEVRLFGGYYHFNNPVGGDYEGFKARLEARLLPGVIADVAYWDDTALMGGHWSAGVRASVPFSLLRVLHGENPFKGFTDAFTPRPREFCERMSDMVIREHRVQTVVSDRRLVDQDISFHPNGAVLAPGAVRGGGGVPFE